MFRKNETANECIDYVQFKLSNGQTTQKFCGILNTAFSMDHRFQDPFHYSANGIGTAKSQKDLEVIIFISKEPLQEGETMNLEIAFTLYTGKGAGCQEYFSLCCAIGSANTKEPQGWNISA